jgi:tetratricopeptide (TPR) repeat protein
VAWLGAIALAVTAGMFSKESAIVAVGVIGLYDLTFVRGVSWRSRIPGYIAVAIPCLVFLYVRARVIASAPFVLLPFTDNPLTGVGFWTARMTAVKVIGRYFQLLVWPAGLSFDYSYNAIPLFGWKLSGWEDWKAVFALVACSAAAVAALVAWRRNKPVFFAIAFFFITLAPASNMVILIGSIMGERFLYLPSMGFAAIAVWAFYAIWLRLPANAAGTVLGVILIAFAVRTYDRNLDWQDQQRFWRSAVEAAPGSYKAHIGAISNQLQVTQQDWQRSLRDVSRALATLDGLPDLQNAANAYCDAGIFYRSLGDKVESKTEAADWYRKSLEALLRSEKILLAQDDKYREENARRGKPGLTFIPSVVYLELGRTYIRLSEPRKAIEAFERGRSLESDPDVLEELASAYRAAGDPRKAAIALVEALSVDSSRTQLSAKLVELYGEIDPGGCAVSRQGGSASLNLDCPLVHGDLCTASRNVTRHFLRRGQQFEAAAIRRIAAQELGCEAGLLE